jgi:hypothetical protein
VNIPADVADLSASLDLASGCVRFRVLKAISSAFALKFVARWLLARRKAGEKGDGDDADLPEVHASAAGLKGRVTSLVTSCAAMQNDPAAAN